MTHDIIDLRSDVATQPTEAMWHAMRQTRPQFSLSGRDETVCALEDQAAALLGKEAGLFVPTCSMANLLALMTLGQRGTQMVLEATSHIAWSEEWSYVYICGLFPRLLPGNNGVLEPADVEAAIVTPQFQRLPQTSVLCLENSHNNPGGVALTAGQTAAVAEVAHRHNVAVHLDGARLFNTAAALAVTVKDLAAPVDTVAISLNKGLGALVGAVLCGTQATIETARINAKRIGAASIYKAGIFAAAGLVALAEMAPRVGEDNGRAAHLARLLAQVPGIKINLDTVQTNIVQATIERDALSAHDFVARLEAKGVLALPRSEREVRFVTHYHIGPDEVERAAAAVAAVLA